MDDFINILTTHKDAIGTVALALNILQYLTGIFLCYKIYRRKDSDGVPLMCFLGTLAVGLVGIQYGQIINDPHIFLIHVVCAGLNAVYTAIHIFYCSNWKDEVLVPFIECAVVVAGTYAYAYLENENLLQERFGMVFTACVMLAALFPIIELRTIYREKDASHIPFVFLVLYSLVSIFGLLHAVAINNQFLMIQNFVTLLICSAQTACRIKYPGHEKYA